MNDIKQISNFHQINIKDRLIVSVDLSSKQEIIKLCTQIKNNISTLKIGFEVIYSCGLDIIKTIKSFGYEIMLDAKLHDIPNTVGRAMNAITLLGVSKVTMHSSGGTSMLKTAKESAESAASKAGIKTPMLFAVTILTSLDNDDLKIIGFEKDFRLSVAGLADMAFKSGIDGIVCSPNEVIYLREKLGKEIYIATPGIRLVDDGSQDQKRISNPFAAIKNGADYIIVGRPVTQADNPADKVRSILEDIEKAGSVV
ncbi:MAG: orotidine-5'-phosphate decarboxylase [Actinobacteria bacterium]|nr:orotidine-5'-phosphate decarboxylase [Actinomycetota bacterium]